MDIEHAALRPLSSSRDLTLTHFLRLSLSCSPRGPAFAQPCRVLWSHTRSFHPASLTSSPGLE